MLNLLPKFAQWYHFLVPDIAHERNGNIKSSPICPAIEIGTSNDGSVRVERFNYILWRNDVEQKVIFTIFPAKKRWLKWLSFVL